MYTRALQILKTRTDSDGLDLDAILNMRAARIIGLLVIEYGLSAESVDKGGSAY